MKLLRHELAWEVLQMVGNLRASTGEEPGSETSSIDFRRHAGEILMGFLMGRSKITDYQLENASVERNENGDIEAVEYYDAAFRNLQIYRRKYRGMKDYLYIGSAGGSRDVVWPIERLYDMVGMGFVPGYNFTHQLDTVQDLVAEMGNLLYRAFHPNFVLQQRCFRDCLLRRLADLAEREEACEDIVVVEDEWTRWLLWEMLHDALDRGIRKRNRVLGLAIQELNPSVLVLIQLLGIRSIYLHRSIGWNDIWPMTKRTVEVLGRTNIEALTMESPLSLKCLGIAQEPGDSGPNLDPWPFLKSLTFLQAASGSAMNRFLETQLGQCGLSLSFRLRLIMPKDTEILIDRRIREITRSLDIYGSFENGQAEACLFSLFDMPKLEKLELTVRLKEEWLASLPDRELACQVALTKLKTGILSPLKKGLCLLTSQMKNLKSFEAIFIDSADFCLDDAFTLMFGQGGETPLAKSLRYLNLGILLRDGNLSRGIVLDKLLGCTELHTLEMQLFGLSDNEILEERESQITTAMKALQRDRNIRKLTIHCPAVRLLNEWLVRGDPAGGNLAEKLECLVLNGRVPRLLDRAELTELSRYKQLEYLSISGESFMNFVSPALLCSRFAEIYDLMVFPELKESMVLRLTPENWRAVAHVLERSPKMKKLHIIVDDPPAAPLRTGIVKSFLGKISRAIHPRHSRKRKMSLRRVCESILKIPSLTELQLDISEDVPCRESMELLFGKDHLWGRLEDATITLRGTGPGRGIWTKRGGATWYSASEIEGRNISNSRPGMAVFDEWGRLSSWGGQNPRF